MARHLANGAAQPVSRPVWSAFCDGYERGIQHGYARAMADVLNDLRQASHHVIDAGWVPEVVRAFDAAQHRAARAATPPPGPDFTDPAAIAAYRARVRSSWDLPPARTPTTRPQTAHAHIRGAAA